MSVLVTGASGVVGGAVTALLVGQGRRVRALARSAESTKTVAGLGAAAVAGDILDYPSLLTAMTGCEVVFHVAGRNAMCLRDPTELFRVNVDGTRNVLRAAAAAGVGRLVYTSSAVTLGEAAGTVGDEGSAHRGWFLSHYERSKYQAERVLLEEKTPVEVVVVNPSSVQGPGRATGTGKIVLDLLNGRLPALVDSRLSIVDIDDCARGHLLAEQRGKPGERYVLNGFTLKTREAVTLLEQVSGLALRVRYLPGWPARAGAAVVEVVSHAVGRRPPVCREMVRTLLHGHAYDGSRATRELGLDYTAAEDTMRRLVGWLAEEGLLRRELPGAGRA